MRVNIKQHYWWEGIDEDVDFDEKKPGELYAQKANSKGLRKMMKAYVGTLAQPKKVLEEKLENMESERPSSLAYK